jgi:ferredoxin
MSTKIVIYYFSGTGNTRHVAALLQQHLVAAGATVDIVNIDQHTKGRSAPDITAYDMVGIAHPIHGWGVPRPIHQFLRRLPSASGKRAFVFRTAAGGNAPINNGTSWPTLRVLSRKGYHVFYDRTFLMPSNWLFAHPVELNKQACDVVAEKTREMAAALLAGTERRIDCSPATILFTYLLWMTEDFGARWFGKDLHTTKACTKCGKCARECPTGNIVLRNNKIRFGWKCTWCMHCVYGCPSSAITPYIEKFVVLKDGYSLKKILDSPSSAKPFVTADAQGAYSHFAKYFSGPAE